MTSTLSTTDFSLEITLNPFDNQRLLELSGQLEEHIRLVEQRLEVQISYRGNVFQISGKRKLVQVAKQVLLSLYQQTETLDHLTPRHVHLALQEHLHTGHTSTQQPKESGTHMQTSEVVRKKRFELNPRSPNQKKYINNIEQHPITFGIGPAGTGKTFLAVACAAKALEQEKIRRILLVRPAVEAGEKLGFLPGDLAQKIDPYLRPLYDALYETLGFERVEKLIEKQVIEIAPLAYMRGRTLNDAFIILDEGQNTTVEQMKMFLTRIGFSSTAVITGDVTQVDLPRGKDSGLKHVIDILQPVPEVSFTFFESKDVVRHPVVQKIIDAYTRHEQKPGGTQP